MGYLNSLLHLLVFCIKYYDTLILLILIKRFFMLVTALEPNRHAPSGFPRMMPIVLLRADAFSICNSDFKKPPSPS